MPTVAGSASELLRLLAGLARIEDDHLIVENEAGFRSTGTLHAGNNEGDRR